jgi:hypothetical protein
MELEKKPEAINPQVQSYLAAIGIRLTPDQLRDAVAYIDKIEGKNNTKNTVVQWNKDELSATLEVDTSPLTLNNLEQAINQVFEILYTEYTFNKKNPDAISKYTWQVRIGRRADFSFQAIDQLLGRTTQAIGHKMVFNMIIEKFKDKGLLCEDTEYFDLMKGGSSPGTGTFRIGEKQNELPQTT